MHFPYGCAAGRINPLDLPKCLAVGRGQPERTAAKSERLRSSTQVRALRDSVRPQVDPSELVSGRRTVPGPPDHPGLRSVCGYADHSTQRYPRGDRARVRANRSLRTGRPGTWLGALTTLWDRRLAAAQDWHDDHDGGGNRESRGSSGSRQSSAQVPAATRSLSLQLAPCAAGINALARGTGSHVGQPHLPQSPFQVRVGHGAVLLGFVAGLSGPVAALSGFVAGPAALTGSVADPAALTGFVADPAALISPVALTSAGAAMSSRSARSCRRPLCVWLFIVPTETSSRLAVSASDSPSR